MTQRTTDGDCPYCRIATGDNDPPLRVERDDALVAAPPADHQLSKGHVVVFAPAHVETFASLDSDVAAGLSRAAHFAATVMDGQFGASDVTILGAGARRPSPATSTSTWFRAIPTTASTS